MSRRSWWLPAWRIPAASTSQSRFKSKQSTSPTFGTSSSCVVYIFRKVLLPNFLSYDDGAGQPCLNSQFSETDLLSALLKSGNLKYRTVIQVSSEQAYRTVPAAEYVTSDAYDMEAMYRTIETEGNRRCGS
jgi:hypothetical protein